MLEVAASLDGPALVRVPLAIRAAGPNRFTALGTVPLGALRAGDYIVRGVTETSLLPALLALALMLGLLIWAWRREGA